MVFSQAWFEQHQSRLLRLLALPILGRLFRRALAIRPHDIGYHKPIVELTPHSYTVANDDGTFTTDFRTHAKYGKRLYYAGLPLWKALHAWDMAIANPLVPALNAGFDTLPFYSDPDPETATVDGVLRNLGFDVWTNFRNAATSTDAVDNSISGSAQEGGSVGLGANTTTWRRLTRSAHLFNTASLTVKAAITSAVFSVYGSGVSAALGSGADCNICSFTPSSNTALAVADFASFGITPYCDTPMTLGAFSTTGYNAFTLNALGKSAIAKAGITAIGARNFNYDVSNVTPPFSASGDTTDQFDWFYADQPGTTNDPKLEVTFALSASLPFAHLSAGNGMSIASQWRN